VKKADEFNSKIPPWQINRFTILDYADFHRGLKLVKMRDVQVDVVA
jgi:hypothetical protein